jgi:predicted dehydrogenase
MKLPLQLGIIGFSEGNGHPYSWSAIFNGYNAELMETCGFPVIPRYLEEQNFPEARLHEARVTCIWTQDKNLSRHIAETCYIDTVVVNPEEMIGKIDGLLLARDDAENHYTMSKPFIEAGLPIYIDKPLAFSVNEAQKIIDLQVYQGQIFTCSALKYAQELEIDSLDLNNISLIKGQVPKDWDKYAIHIIEPILKNLNKRCISLGHVQGQVSTHASLRKLTINLRHNLEIEICATGQAGDNIFIEVFGDKNTYKLEFRNTFDAFRSALKDFCEGIKNSNAKVDLDFVLKSIKILEMGRGN